MILVLCDTEEEAQAAARAVDACTRAFGDSLVACAVRRLPVGSCHGLRDGIDDGNLLWAVGEAAEVAGRFLMHYTGKQKKSAGHAPGASAATPACTGDPDQVCKGAKR